MPILNDLPSFDRTLGERPLVMLFKHSPICPVSAAAYDEWTRFVHEYPDASTLFVDVIADRAVARGIAERCGVTHQSPQAILFKDGEVAWHASHGGITSQTLGQAWGSETT